MFRVLHSRDVVGKEKESEGKRFLCACVFEFCDKYLFNFLAHVQLQRVGSIVKLSCQFQLIDANAIGIGILITALIKIDPIEQLRKRSAPTRPHKSKARK